MFKEIHLLSRSSSPIFHSTKLNEKHEFSQSVEGIVEALGSIRICFQKLMPHIEQIKTEVEEYKKLVKTSNNQFELLSASRFVTQGELKQIKESFQDLEAQLRERNKQLRECQIKLRDRTLENENLHDDRENISHIVLQACDELEGLVIE